VAVPVPVVREKVRFVSGGAGPAVRAANRAPRGELVRMPGGHYEPFLGGHEQAVEAELSFLRRHLLDRSRTDRPGEVTADSAQH
jgi:hypothetical protein